MKRLIAGLALACISLSAMLFSLAGLNTSSFAGTTFAAPVQDNPCPPGWYRNNIGKCTKPNSNSLTTMSVAKAGVTLKMTGSKATRGTQITVSPVTLRHPHRSGHTFRVFATGKMPAMTLTRKGAIYWYVPKTNRWSKISRIMQPGIYEAVYSR